MNPKFATDIDDGSDKTEGVVPIGSKELLSALERSMRKSEYANSCATVVAEIQIGSKRAQVQVVVTKDENHWFDIKHAGIKCR